MKGRTGFIIGVGVGYVLATKTTRPAQGVVAAPPIARTPQVPPVAVEADHEGRSRTQQILGKGLRAASDALRNGA